MDGIIAIKKNKNFSIINIRNIKRISAVEDSTWFLDINENISSYRVDIHDVYTAINESIKEKRIIPVTSKKD